MSTIHDAFRPFYHCGRLLGFFSFTFEPPPDADGTKNGAETTTITNHSDAELIARTSVRNVVLLLLNVCVSSACMAMVQTTNEMALSNIKSTVLDSSLMLAFTLGIVASMLTYALLFGFRFRIARIVTDLCRLDEEMHALGVCIRHDLHRRFVLRSCWAVGLIELCLVVFTSGAVYYAFPVSFRDSLQNTIIYVYTTMTYSVMMAGYGLALYAVVVRVRLLNEHIRRMAGFAWSSERTRHVQRMGLVYEALTRLCDECNFCFALPVMAWLMVAFSYNIICVYVMYMRVRGTMSLADGLHFMVNACWNVFFLGFVGMVVFAGSGVARAGRGTGQAIHAVMNTAVVQSGCDARDDGGAAAAATSTATVAAFRQQLAFFSQQVLHKHPVASCGLFHFDWTLAYSMIATSGTYLIIMVQFDSSVEFIARNGTELT